MHPRTTVPWAMLVCLRVQPLSDLATPLGVATFRRLASFLPLSLSISHCCARYVARPGSLSERGERLEQNQAILLIRKFWPTFKLSLLPFIYVKHEDSAQYTLPFSLYPSLLPSVCLTLGSCHFKIYTD